MQAAQLAQRMYDSNKFTSDLTNSYAWDTATLFLQIYGTNGTYSRKIPVSEILSQTGTNTQNTKDVQCNVYDMASNVYEWSTETSNYSNKPCVPRGGNYVANSTYTNQRNIYLNYDSYGDIGFRPVLYINV